ncbi:MAG: hypothetical protein JW888_14420 [Pirellulales bacterium]|nr:hypothetical protein [Pirellulales bacterium]
MYHQPIRRAFDGLTPGHTRGEMVRCILEAVAVELRHQVDVLSEDTRPKNRVSLGGLVIA